MIKPEGIPKFEGNLEQVTQAAKDLTAVGTEITTIGQNLESTFRTNMEANYANGPEKHLLVRAMEPVKKEGELFGPNLGKIGSALHTFVSDVSGHKTGLADVRTRADAWKREVGDTPEDEIDDNEDWVKEENQLHKDLQDHLDKISAAERKCANAIADLYGGKKWEDSGLRQGEKPPEDNGEEEKDPPWGKPLEYDAPWYEDCVDFVGGVLKGIFVDGLLGTLDALTTLIPIQPLLKSLGVDSIFGYELKGWSDCGTAWKGVGLTLASAAMYAIPGAAVFMHAVFPETAAYLDTVGLTVLKGMVAWDMWGEDPGRALGQVGFNVITTIGTGGAAGGVRATAIAGKYGAAAAKVAKGADMAVNVAGKLRPGQLAINTAMKLPKVSDLVIKVGDAPVIGGLAKFGGLDIPTSKAGLPHAGGVEVPNVTPASVGSHSSSSSSPATHVDIPSSPSGGSNYSGGGHTNTPSSPTGGHSDTPSGGHSDTPASRADSPASRSDAPASHSDAPAPHTDSPAGRQSDAPATHSDTPSRADAPATHSDSPNGSGSDSPNGSHGDGPAGSGSDSPSGSHSDSPSSSRSDSPNGSHSDSPSSSRSDSPNGSHSDSPASSRSDSPNTTHGDSPNGSRTDSPNGSHGDSPPSRGDSSPSTHADGQTTPGTHTPDRPGTHTPDAPAAHHTPAAPRTNTPDAPRSPDAPNAHTPDAPRTHTPDAPRTHTPDSPNTHTPDAPRTPDAPHTRTPDAPAAHHTPDTPPTHTPDSPNTHAPDAPRTPDAPHTRTPDVPAAHHAADAPRTPDAPSTHTPDALAARHTADAPTRTPDAPHTGDVVPPVVAPHLGGRPGGHGPDAPRGTTPHQPNTPHNPNAPHAPNQPNAPHAPNQPNAPQTPNQPNAPHAPNQPNAPQVPNQPPPVRVEPHAHGRPGEQRHHVEPSRYNPKDRFGLGLRKLKAKIGDDPLKNVADWIKEGNPRFRDGRGPRSATNNCGDNSRAFADNLQGGEPRLANNDLRTGVTPDGKKVPVPGERSEMYEYTGVRPESIQVRDANGNPIDPKVDPKGYTMGAYKRIYDDLRNQPPGTVAVVGGTWARRGPNGEVSGHWFNAFVDDAGKVKWADMQSGKITDGPPYAALFDELEVMTRRPGGAWQSPLAPSWKVDGPNYQPNPWPANHPHQPSWVQPAQPHIPPMPQHPPAPHTPRQPHAPQQPPVHPQQPFAPQQPHPQQPYAPVQPHPQQPYAPQHPAQPSAPQQPHPAQPYPPQQPHPPQPQQPPVQPHPQHPHAPQQPHPQQPVVQPHPTQPSAPQQPHPQQPVAQPHPHAPQQPAQPQQPYAPQQPQPSAPVQPHPQQPAVQPHPAQPHAPEQPQARRPEQPSTKPDGHQEPAQARHPERPASPERPADRAPGAPDRTPDGGRVRDPREEFMQRPGDWAPGGSDRTPDGGRPRDPREDFMQRPAPERPGTLPDARRIADRLHPDGPPARPADAAPRDPNRIPDRLHPDGPPARPADAAPRDPNRIPDRLHPDGHPARPVDAAPRDPNRIPDRLHPDGPPARPADPAPRDPNWLENRLNPKPDTPPIPPHHGGPDTPPYHGGPGAPPRDGGSPQPPRNDSWGSGPQDHGGQPPTSRDGGQPPAQHDGQEPSGVDSSGGHPENTPAPGQDHLPSDSHYGVSKKEGFDPAFHHKALGDDFTPGVHDPDGTFDADERAIADTVAEQRGWHIDGREADHTIEGQKNPECMTRKDPNDPGVVTEYKTLEPTVDAKNPSGAVRRNIFKASDQVPPNTGEIVIDGRKIGLTEEDALRGFKRAVGQPKGTMVKTVHIIVEDGRMLTYVKREN